MKTATRAVASVFGVYAGLLGVTHGVLEVAQGNEPPSGLMIYAMGPPCQPHAVWHACFPAVTIVPSYVVTGLLAILISLAVVVWAALFVERKRGGVVLILLSMLMLPVGGGIIPVVIGVIAGAAGTRINAPPTWLGARLSGGSLDILARLWPWPLVAYFVWIPSQYVLGHFLNDFMMKQAFPALLLEFVLLLLSILTALADDVKKEAGLRQGGPAKPRYAP